MKFTFAHNYYENPAIGIYFIEDPDGYWVEVVPEKH
jgi:lactoylglutathione lyase